jgi:hypothetical protein
MLENKKHPVPGRHPKPTQIRPGQCYAERRVLALADSAPATIWAPVTPAAPVLAAKPVLLRETR